jgi:hypothetical protein
MLSERQIKHLLETFESRANRPLTKLRGRLLRNENPQSEIWELIVLYTLQNLFRSVVPENADGMPDAIAKQNLWRACSFEAALVTSQTSADVNRSLEFTNWVYREVKSAGIVVNGAAISVNPVAGSEDASEIPNEHRWRAMRKSESWREFIRTLRDGGRACWVCPEGNIQLFFESRNGETITTRPLQPNRIRDITKHPVYREVRKKSGQIRGWKFVLRLRPVVLVICVPGHGSEFSKHVASQEYSVERAVWCALLDHNRLSDLERINRLGQRIWWNSQGAGVESKRLRVPKSHGISAVLVVRIGQESGAWKSATKMEARSELFVNPHCRHSLSARFLSEIRRLNFNAVEYGPGWESWQGTHKDDLKVRNSRRTGSFEVILDKEVIEMRLPVMQIMKILAGEVTAKDAFSVYGEEQPHPLRFFQQVLSQELSIEAIEIVDTDPTTRADVQVAFRFRTGTKSVVARTRDEI